MSGSFLPLQQAQAAREHVVVSAFEQAGAVSPSSAVPLASLPALDADILETLIVRGVVREGAPGTYYHFPAPRFDLRARWRRVVAFWLIILGVPLLFLWLAGIFQ